MKSSTTRERLTAALALIDDPIGEGARTCLTVYRDSARAEAAECAADHADGSPTIAEMTPPDVFARKNALLLAIPRWPISSP